MTDRSVLRRLALADFRSYETAALALDGRPVWLAGPNGAGKTNVLEAVSFLSPGRGLRNAGVAEVGRRLPGEARGRAWSVRAEVGGGEDAVVVGTGVESAGAARRVVRIAGAPAPPGRLAEMVRLVWLTPQQDRLFLEGASERRRFLDRLTFAAEPAHARWCATYEKALRERLALLTEGGADPAWLAAVENGMAEAGVLVAAARARTLAALRAEIDGRADRPFPQADLSMAGDSAGGDLDAEAEALRRALQDARARDAAAGRSLTGPHRTDLRVRHRAKDRDAADCSTGEQKALLLNLVLAQAARLSRDADAPNPVLLLDEVAAHLDVERRVALFDEIVSLGLQAFLTGTDASLFEGLSGRAHGVRVEGGVLRSVED